MAGTETIETPIATDTPGSPGPAQVPATPPAQPAPSTPDRSSMTADQLDDAVYDMLEAGRSDLDRFLAGEPDVDPVSGNGAPRHMTDGPTGDEPPVGAPPASLTEDAPEPGAEPRLSKADALSILRRDGWQEDQLTGLPEETLFQVAAHRRQVQAESDRLGNHHHELTQRIAKLEGFLQAVGQGASPDAPAQQPQDPRLASLAEKAKSEVGEEFSKELTTTLAQIQGELHETRRLRQQEELSTARKALVSEYPKLDPNAGEQAGADYKRVLERMSALAGSVDRQSGRPLYENRMTDLMRDAALLEFGKDMRAATQQAITREHQTQATGQPEPPAGEAETPTALSDDDKMDQVMDLLEKGVDPARARSQVYAGIPA